MTGPKSCTRPSTLILEFRISSSDLVVFGNAACCDTTPARSSCSLIARRLFSPSRSSEDQEPTTVLSELCTTNLELDEGPDSVWSVARYGDGSLRAGWAWERWTQDSALPWPSSEANSASRTSAGRIAGTLCRRRYQKTSPTKIIMARTQLPPTIPPMVPPFNLRSNVCQHRTRAPKNNDRSRR